MSARHTWKRALGPLLCAIFFTAPFSHSAPEAPQNVWDYPPMNLLREGEVMSAPHLPPLRLNRDGRLGVRVGTPTRDIELFLLAPEKIAQPFLLNRPGVQGLASLDPHVLPASLIEDQVSGEFVARAICDPDTRRNPYQCGINNTHACYDITLVGVVSDKNRPVRFASLDIAIELENPATPQVALHRVEVSQVNIGDPIIESMDNLFEPSMTGDGLLWVGKFTSKGGKRWNWRNPQTGKVTAFPPQARPIVYSMNQKSACDIEGWQNFSPLSHAPYDPELNQRYGFAHYPIRDPEGNTIADGDIIAADQYPWISRDGSMFFLETGGDMLFYYDDNQQKVVSRYPARCALQDNCLWDLIKGHDSKENILLLERHFNINRNVSLFGAWTHGKMVIVDNALNFMDYGPNDGLDQHFYVSLYDTSKKISQNPVHQAGEVLMANNKQTLRTIPGTVNEGAQLGSIENRFNHLKNLKPITPRDVVWLFSKGNGASVELVFDDYIAHDILIYAPMNASFANHDALSVEIQGMHAGFTRTADLSGKGFDGQTPIRLQNAATSSESISDTHAFMHVPAYGEVSGKIRIEPYALGGIEGKGLWLEGNNGIHFSLPEQKKAHAYNKKDWYIGIFLDHRAEQDAQPQRILHLPDKSTVWQHGNQWIFKSPKGEVLGQYAWQSDTALAWQHLGLKLTKKQIDIYHNGMLVQQFPSKKAFQLQPGELSIGNPRQDITIGFKGWIDDLKVIAVGASTSQEMYCEHARGTLIASHHALNQRSVSPLKAWAKKIQSELTTNGKNLGHKHLSCLTNYRSEMGANYARLPEQAISLRDALLQPQTIVADKPRPDETDNVFCLSCHSEGLHKALGVEALALKNIPAQQDLRRQPLQPLIDSVGF